MKVQITSKDTIKPSHPTPNHLKSFKLSLLDQLAPPVYVPIIFFYSINTLNQDRLIEKSRLKESLSQTLTHFYPLAGRIKPDFSIDCNDDGVDYFEANISCKLSEVIEQPDVYVLEQFFPCDSHGTSTNLETGSSLEPVLLVQVNVFECGGIAIALRLSHQIADASSLSTFINAWAVTCLGGSTLPVDRKFFEFVSLFPPMDLSGLNKSTWIAKEKLVTKRFVFDPTRIRDTSSSNNSCVNNATGFETVSAFIWNRLIKINRAKKESDLRSYVAIIAVNLRGRLIPPLSKQSFGNNLVAAKTEHLTDEIQNEDKIDLVSKIRNAIRKVDNKFVKELEDTYVNFIKTYTENLKDDEIGMVKLNFSSWCKFPYYEVDFGWGKPTWVTTIGLPFKNTVIFLDTRKGDAIEAWLNMSEEDMFDFENDPEILAFSEKTNPQVD